LTWRNDALKLRTDDRRREANAKAAHAVVE
jgi:hypothetical protein